MTMTKRSKLAAMSQMRCPRCREGAMFKHPLLGLKFNKIHENCPVCGATFTPEPGFYYGAMYFSYAINTLMVLSLFVVVLAVFKPRELWVYLATVITPVLLLFPIVFRFSRVLMLHLFGGYSYQPEILAEQTRPGPRP